MVTIWRASLVIPSVSAHISTTGTPDLGADGEDYRADFVHGPLSRKISTPSALLSGAWFGGCQPARHRSRGGTMMSATSNPQTAAEQARKSYRDVTTRLGQLGLDIS